MNNLLRPLDLTLSCVSWLLAVQTEKALLLASLLLGFGLDAWVVFGTDAIGQHTWVLTRSSREDVVFWDACTGEKLLLPSWIKLDFAATAVMMALLKR